MLCLLSPFAPCLSPHNCQRPEITVRGRVAEVQILTERVKRQKRLCDSRHFKSNIPLTDNAVRMSEIPDWAFEKHLTCSSWALELYPSELLVSLAVLLEHLYWLSVETSFSKIITFCTTRRGHFPLCYHTCHWEPSGFCLWFSTDKQWSSSDNWSHYSGGTAVSRMLLFIYPVSIYQTLRK